METGLTLKKYFGFSAGTTQAASIEIKLVGVARGPFWHEARLEAIDERPALKTVKNQHTVVKAAFENQSGGKFSVNIKMNDFVGNILQIRFTPAVTSCYPVHALNSDGHLSASLLCYFRCN